MTNQRMLNQLERVIAHLSMPFSLLSWEGDSLIPNDDIRFSLPALPVPGTAVYCEGRMFQRCAAEPEWVLMATTEDTSSARDCFHLCDEMIAAMLSASEASNDITHAYLRILQNDLMLTELDALVVEHRIAVEQDRCVLLMHMLQVKQRSACEILEEILPRSSSDILIPIDKHTAALIKDATGIEELDEMRQFACAVQETLLGETALDVAIGIGDIVSNVHELHSSYRQARRAMEIGRNFASERTIHVYRFMLLERFLSDLTPDMAQHYHELLFNRQTARLFSDEMLTTIDMFFRKDLNLSDTARQLYIHRNTLVYRLDKIQRQIGLDLRNFEDAVTFKMLMDMRKCYLREETSKKNGRE